MPKFVIDRNIPGAGKLTPAELQAISATSCGVLRDLGPSIQGVHSYVTDDKIYCVYNAPDAALVKPAARPEIEAQQDGDFCGRGQKMGPNGLG